MREQSKARRALACLLLAALMFALAGCSQQTQSQTAAAQQDNASAATYTVTLNPAGGAWADGSTEAVTVDVKEGTAIDFAAHTPTLEGNDLLGWYQQDGYPWPGARKVTGDLSLRAKWSATEVEAVYDLVLTINGEKETLEYESGVYQFTHVSQIYGGYAQRAGKYTVYEQDLKNAIAADDGKVQRVLYHADSNYIDATGTIYAEFYNDGEFELYYDYTNAGQRTKYCMNTGYWTLAGYTAPFEATPIPVDETGMGYTSAHLDWDASLTGLDEATADAGDTGEDSAEAAADIVTLPGDIIYTADATVSETMKANFFDNGTMAIYMTSYGVNVDAKYLWAFDEAGTLSLTYNGSEENLLRANDDGTFAFDDNYNNTYTVDAEALKAAVVEPVLFYTANSVNSDTMFVFFYSDHTATVNFSLASFGMEGQYHITAEGYWRVNGDNVELVLGGKNIDLALEGDQTSPQSVLFTFQVDENTYAATPMFYLNLRNMDGAAASAEAPAEAAEAAESAEPADETSEEVEAQ